jgi:hypothetical protein
MDENNTLCLRERIMHVLQDVGNRESPKVDV